MVSWKCLYLEIPLEMCHLVFKGVHNVFVCESVSVQSPIPCQIKLFKGVCEGPDGHPTFFQGYGDWNWWCSGNTVQEMVVWI